VLILARPTAHTNILMVALSTGPHAQLDMSPTSTHTLLQPPAHLCSMHRLRLSTHARRNTGPQCAACGLTQAISYSCRTQGHAFHLPHHTLRTRSHSFAFFFTHLHLIYCMHFSTSVRHNAGLHCDKLPSINRPFSMSILNLPDMYHDTNIPVAFFLASMSRS
jgi:hypothetical protein